MRFARGLRPPGAIILFMAYSFKYTYKIYKKKYRNLEYTNVFIL